MRPTVYALISETSGNCIAICVNVEDALSLKIDCDYHGSKRDPQMKYEVKPITRQEAEELLRRPWVDLSTAIGFIVEKAS
jgi:hypothetical protein